MSAEHDTVGLLSGEDPLGIDEAFHLLRLLVPILDTAPHDGWAHLARVTDAVESSHSGSSDELFGWLVEDLPKWSLDSGKQFGRRRRSSAESRYSFGVKDEIAPDANEFSAERFVSRLRQLAGEHLNLAQFITGAV